MFNEDILESGLKLLVIPELNLYGQILNGYHFLHLMDMLLSFIMTLIPARGVKLDKLLPTNMIQTQYFGLQKHLMSFLKNQINILHLIES